MKSEMRGISQRVPNVGNVATLKEDVDCAEAMARNPGVEYNLSHAEWHQEGEVSISPNWCLTVDGLLLNGSKTHSGVEPTVLTTGQILDAITAVTDIAFGGPVKVSLGSPKQIDRAVDRSERKRLANDNTPLAGQFASSSVLGGFQAAA